MSPKVADEHKESRKKQILEAAVRVFCRIGYQAATMKDVVEESGLSRGGVYLYYGSTEQMMLDLLHEVDQNVADLTKLIREDRPIWEIVESVIRQSAEEARDCAEGMVPVYYEFFITAWRKRTYEAWMAERYRNNLDVIVLLLEEGVSRGEFQPAVPVGAIARMVFSFHDGLQIHAVEFGEELIDTLGQTEALLASLKYLLGVTAKEEQA